jgi:transcription antitermination protein NusB
MASRRKCREWAVQLLFTLDVNQQKLDDLFASFWQERNVDKKSRDFTEAVARGVVEHITELDELLHKHAANWDLSRMGGVERNAMRLASYEMLYCKDIPPVVSINEAVDIAKYFSKSDSGRFVNGVLDAIRKSLTRPART